MGSAQVEFNSQSMSAHNSNVSLVAKEISRVKEELIAGIHVAFASPLYHS